MPDLPHVVMRRAALEPWHPQRCLVICRRLHAKRVRNPRQHGNSLTFPRMVKGNTKEQGFTAPQTVHLGFSSLQTLPREREGQASI